MSICPLHYEIKGEGEKFVLFLPGLGLNHHIFDDVVKELEKDFKIILIDLYGTGKSPKPIDFYSIKKDAQTILPLLKNIKELFIVAHSRGVKVALFLEEIFPNIKCFIFIGQAGFGDVDKKFTKNVLKIKKMKIDNKEEIVKILNEDINIGKIIGGISVIEKIKKAKEGNDLVDTILRRKEDTKDLAKIAKQIDRPVYLIAGEFDPFLKDLKSAINIYRRAKLIIVEKAGHFPMVENSKTFSKIILEILKGEKDDNRTQLP